MPLGNDVAGLSRQQNCSNWDPDKERKEVICKNISGPSREYANLQDIIGNTTGSRNVSFPAVVKGVSSREAHHGPDRSTAHRRRSKESRINITLENSRSG